MLEPGPTVAQSPAVAAVLQDEAEGREASATSATVNWATDRSQSTGTAAWGAVVGGVCTPVNVVPASRFSITVGATSEYQWSAVLDFPGRGTYCYRVYLGTTDLLGGDASPRVTTAAAPGTSFSFAVLGDWGSGTTGQANVFNQMAASPAAFVVTTGDNVYNSGTETDYGDLSAGKAFRPQYIPMLGGRPIFAAQGNHGFTTNLPYVQNLRAPTSAAESGGRFNRETYCCISTMSGPKTYASTWYAFNWGSARFYVLEATWADGQGGYQGDFLAHWNGPVTGCTPCGAQRAWLEADLAAHPGTLKFAFLHYPIYTDGAEGASTYLQGSSSLEGLLARNGVGIAFSGHAHIYERNYPQITGRPMVTYVTGGGGAAPGSVSGCSSFDAYAIGSKSSCRAPRPTSNSQIYHFLLVNVDGNQVTVTPTDSLGRTFDVQTYTFPSGSDTEPPSAPQNLAGAAVNSTRIDLTWTASTDNVGVVRYNILRDGAQVATVSGDVTSYSDIGLAPGTPCSYVVTASDADLNTSAPSAERTITTPEGAGTFVFTLTDDSYVDASFPDSNFGTNTRVMTDNSPVVHGFMRFVVSTGSCQVIQATLSLTVGSGSSDGSTKGGDVRTVVNSSWQEETVTWNTAPAAGSGILASLGAVAIGTTYDVDVTAGVSGDGAVSFTLESTSSDGARYYSKEGSATQGPRLTVVCA